MRPVEMLMFTSLTLSATGLFRFVALVLGVDIGTVSAGLLALNVIYLAHHSTLLNKLFLRTNVKHWMVLIAYWPLMTVVYAPAFDLRAIALQIYFATLLLASIVFVVVNGLKVAHHMLAISLLLAGAGIILSLVFPSYFENVARLAASRGTFMDRAFGFYLQPNAAATGWNLLFLAWYTLWPGKRSIWDVVAFLVLLAVSLTTGSRTGIATSIFTGLWLLTGSRPLQRNATRRSTKLTIFAIVCTIGIGWVASFAGKKVQQKGDLYDRLTTFSRLRLSDSPIWQDGSVLDRLEAQDISMRLFWENPLLGKGLGFEKYYANRGLHLAPHSSAVESLSRFGAFHPLFFLWLIWRLWKSKHRRLVDHVFESTSLRLFCSICIVLYLLNGHLLDSRVLFVAVGYFYSVSNCPQAIVDVRQLQHERRHGGIGGV